MKFFIPEEQDEKKVEEIYEATKKFAKDTLGWEISNRRIQRITFRDKGKLVRAEVGQIEAISGASRFATSVSNSLFWFSSLAILCEVSRPYEDHRAGYQ